MLFKGGRMAADPVAAHLIRAGAAEIGNVAVAELCEVLGGDLRRLGVADADMVEGARGRTAQEGHRGRSVRPQEVGKFGWRLVRRNPQQPAASVAYEGFEVALLAAGIVAGVEDGHQIALGLEQVADAADDLRVEGIRDPVDHEADLPVLPRPHVGGTAVGDVVQFARRLQHALARPRGDPPGAAQRLARGRERHAGALGDGFQLWPFRHGHACSMGCAKAAIVTDAAMQFKGGRFFRDVAERPINRVDGRGATIYQLQVVPDSDRPARRRFAKGEESGRCRRKSSAPVGIS